MKIFKKISAILLVCILALSVVGCHKKNEVAVTVDGFNFTSAYYMCALMTANGEAQNKVYESLTAAEQQQEIDFYSKKIDNKKFVDWVEDRAIEIIKERAAYKSLCKKANISLDAETKLNVKDSVSQSWDNGYSAYFEPNGVGFDTLVSYEVDYYYKDLYFEHLYGKGGDKEISTEDVKTKLYDNFLTANYIDVTFDQETEDEKKAIETKINGYADKLKNKSMTFEQVYNEHNGIKEEDKKDTETTEPQPKDKYAYVFGADGSGYDYEYYSEMQKMATGEVKVIKKENNAGFVLVVKQDIKADEYYLNELDMHVRHLLKDTEYGEDIAKIAATLKTDISKYAIGQFNVKKIKEPTYE